MHSFFEAGTELGHSLKHALENGTFSELYSTEIHDATASRAKEYFSKNEIVHILNMDSLSGLKAVLNKIPLGSPIFFFLDAHFPGEVEVGFSYADNSPNSLTMPLKEELILISSLRPNSQDVIVVDDLKLYEDGLFENGVINRNFANILSEMRSLNFVQSLYPERDISRSYQDDGYLIIKPKNSSFQLQKLSQLYRLKRNICKIKSRIFKWVNF